ncbi:MAG: alkaline phosphatase family protein [Bryobacteraceae bacterium]|nr:alkaline phosphatase family protein [Bryobacteraceae bacterium]
MTSTMKLAPPAVALLVLAAILVSQPAPTERVGPRPDGSVLLNSGWLLRPAGRQVPMSTMPMSSVLSKDGRFLVVLHGGYLPPTVVTMDVATMTEVSRVPVPDGWLGLSLAPNGNLLYVGGGSQSSVFEFSFSPSDGALKAARTFEVVPKEKRTHEDFIGDVTLSPDGRLIYAAALYRNEIVVINPQSGMIIERWKTGRRPYRILFHPDGKSFFVTSWADGALHHHDAMNGSSLGVVRLGAHPTDIVWRDKPTIATEEEEEEKKEEPQGQSPLKARLFVSAANTNSVYVVGVTETRELNVIERVNVAMTPRQPVGMTPSALALSPDQDRLFIVCSDANAVAVADVRGKRSRVLGFIPTGWYPIAARSLAARRLIVFNGRGGRSYPNPQGPNPVRRPAITHQGTPVVQYVGRLQQGTASVIDPWDDDALAAYTKTVFANSPYRDELLDDANIPVGNPIPPNPAIKSPIEHVIYIVKENRTYDQVLGDLGKGNGDPSLTLFGENITPNHHKLAREFVLFDNFYVSADVSADGHNWSTSAIANDYVQKMWPNSYAARRRHYDYEGGEIAAYPPAGYLWTNAAAAGITMRNYGWWCSNHPQPAEPGRPQVREVRDPVLRPVTNLNYRAYDLDYLDIDRAKTFLGELQKFESEGRLPQLIFLRLGNDHTSGTAPGKPSPVAQVADNDAALGMIVEGVSRSRFWPKTAIFVLEDDAQNGPDHVDSHRSPAFILSPYTRRGIIDSTLYNTTSMLRTMELILGLRPMTQFDAASRPMWQAFSATPNLEPYVAEKARVSLTERNPERSPTAARSLRMDFSEADRIDDDELNEILWLAVKGTEPPRPVRSYFAR